MAAAAGTVGELRSMPFMRERKTSARVGSSCESVSRCCKREMRRQGDILPFALASTRVEFVIYVLLRGRKNCMSENG